MENMGYLIAAYLIAWAALFAYLIWMSGVARTLRAELADLRAALGERERRQAVPEGQRTAPEAPAPVSMRDAG